MKSDPIEAVPASLAERGMAWAPRSLWHSRLHSEPMNMNEVRRPARILMRRRRPGCQAIFSDMR